MKIRIPIAYCPNGQYAVTCIIGSAGEGAIQTSLSHLLDHSYKCRDKGGKALPVNGFWIEVEMPETVMPLPEYPTIKTLSFDAAEQP